MEVAKTFGKTSATETSPGVISLAGKAVFLYRKTAKRHYPGRRACRRSNFFVQPAIVPVLRWSPCLLIRIGIQSRRSAGMIPNPKLRSLPLRLFMPSRALSRSSVRRFRRRHHRRRMFVESLEDRRLLAVSFEFNYIGGNAVGFNHPVDGVEFRSALESAASRLGGWMLHDATIQMDVTSDQFTGQAIAHAISALPPSPAGGGFVHTVISEKVLGLGDANGSTADGELEVFFFSPSDTFTYETDPANVDADNELDFQALVIHELAHTLGFTSATNADGSDDSGGGVGTPGTWRPYDRFVSDVAGNRLIDADPQSPTAFQMDTSATGWPQHSVGGKGPDAGLFFDGPIATAVYGSRVPLYSPATFSLISSVSHLDSEGAPDDSIFSPLTHLMSHATIDRAVPQEFTLVEKAIFADIGIMFVEDTLPEITPPQDLTLEGNATGGFAGTSVALESFLAGAVATDLFDQNVAVTNDAPEFLPLGQNVITFTATDASGNQATATANINVVDTTPPTIDVTPTSATFEATSPVGVTGVSLPFVGSAIDLVDPSPTLVFQPGSNFPLGTTTASFLAQDNSGNQSTFPVSIVVEDTTAPDFALPSSLTIPGNIPGGADLSNPVLMDLFDSLASDLVDQSLTITAVPATFPVGETTVTFTATDDAGNFTDAVSQLTVSGSTYTVTTLDDELDANPGSDLGDLSLREAIVLANVGGGEDRIVFQTGLTGIVSLDSSLGQLQITESLSITGLGQNFTTVDAGGNSRVFDVTATGGDVTLQGLTISGGRLTGDDESGAGILFQSGGTLTINNSTVSGNSTTGLAAAGGGIRVLSGDVRLTDTIVSDNSTGGEFAGGGGLWTGSGNLSLLRSTISGNSTTNDLAFGGGLYVFEGSATISQSTISGNHTEGTRAGGGGLVVLAGSAVIRDSTISGNFTQGNDSDGGGIRTRRSTVELTNSTISGNTAGSFGGGVYLSGSTVEVNHSTITANHSDKAGGGLGAPTDSIDTSLTIDHSIVAGNTDDGTAPDFVGSGVIADASAVRFSLIGDNTGTTLAESQTADPTTGSIIGDPNGAGVIDPLLEPLASAGGPTQTHLPADGSPLIDGGDPLFDPQLFAPPLDNDQRGTGFGRILGDQIDIGAIETPSVTIVWENPADIVFGTSLDSTQLNATASVPGTFVYTPDFGTVLNAGEGQLLSVEFTPDDTANFDVTVATVQINVLRADPVITWPQPASIPFGTALDDTQLNATADVNGTFEYSPPAGTILDAGDDQVLSVTFTPADSQNFNEATASVFIDVTPAVPIVTWDDPDPISFGTPLSETQLNATANVPGSFSYVPPAGIFLSVGNNQTLSVTFTPEDAQNFSPVTETVKIDVVKADPIITWANPADIVVGTQLSVTQLNATASVSGTFTYTPPSGTVLDVGAGQVLMATFTPNESGNFNSITTSVTINVVDLQDYGDAPQSYPVTLADDGARHTTTTLFLGVSVDDDFDGQPSDLADSDGNDDDGVSLIASIVADSNSETTSSISVVASEAGMLDGWIDFNQDGDWDDVGEQIVASVNVVGGSNTISFTVPSGASSGDTAARFRLSSNGGLAPTGSAVDGEVEDYLFTILQSADVSVQAIDDEITIVTDAGNVIVRSGAIDLFAAPQSSIGVLNIVGTVQDETIRLAPVDGAALPAGGLNLQGGGGEDTLALVGVGGVYDLADPAFVAGPFDNVDLSAADTGTLVIDAAAVAELSPVSKSIFVTAGEEDRFVFADVDDWLMTEPIAINGRFIRTATNSISGEVVQLEAPNPWQNFLRIGDVNNDGALTARDALRIINELGRRNFSDSDTEALQDALAVSPWPGVYFDHNGDGRATALDALRVINDLARQSVGSSQGESVAAPFADESNDSLQSETNPQGPIVDAVMVANTPASSFGQAANFSASPTAQATAQPVRSGTDEAPVDQLLTDTEFINSLLPS